MNKNMDNQQANSADPRQHEPLPSWDDEGWDQYLYAVDINYQVDWDLRHGVPPEDVQAMLDEYWETHELDDDES